MKDKLIVALDVDEFGDAKRLVDILSPTVRIFKVGSKLFTSCGLDIIKTIQRKSGRVFLDLKFHDIPNTVFGAVWSATRLGVFMLTVHTLGGANMLKEAVKSVENCAKQINIKKPKILGVTILTSMDARGLKSIGIEKDLKEEVTCLAGLAGSEGLDGVVASAREIPYIRKAAGKNFIIVTPGIRPEGSSKGDQRRITTPGEAIKKGADYIVVGRPIIEAKDPKDAAEKILKEMRNAEK